MSSPLPYTDKFKARCESLMGSIRGRATEKRDKNRRIIRQGHVIPFTIEQFRQWMVAQFGGTEGGVARCCFCNVPVDAYSCVIDHKTPLKRGGSPGLDNLGPTCSTCNDVKGQMTADEFTYFTESLRNMAAKFGPSGVKNITSRLESQTKLAAKARWDQMKKVKEQAQQAAEAFEDF